MEEFICIPDRGERASFRVIKKSVIDAGGDTLASTYWDRRAVGIEASVEIIAPWHRRAPEEIWSLIENDDYTMRSAIEFIEARKYLAEIAQRAVPSRPVGLDGGPHYLKQIYRALQSWFYRTNNPSWRLIVIEEYMIDANEQMTCLGTTTTKVVLELQINAVGISRIYIKEPLSPNPQLHIPHKHPDWWPTKPVASTVVIAWLSKPAIGAIDLLPALKAIITMKPNHEYWTVYSTRLGPVVLYLSKSYKTTHT